MNWSAYFSAGNALITACNEFVLHLSTDDSGKWVIKYEQVSSAQTYSEYVKEILTKPTEDDIELLSASDAVKLFYDMQESTDSSLDSYFFKLVDRCFKHTFSRTYDWPYGEWYSTSDAYPNDNSYILLMLADSTVPICCYSSGGRYTDDRGATIASESTVLSFQWCYVKLPS